MRLLLVAYDFPPSPSPQSLRWAYLVRELVTLGHEVRVITADLPGYGPGGLPEIPAGVRVHRVFPGPFSALLRNRGSRRIGTDDQNEDIIRTRASEPASMRSKGATHLQPMNWKGRFADRLKTILSLILFPDYRAEWLPWARRALDASLSEFKPDIVVTSHEPACSLALGIRASQFGFRWVADLGDPVLAPYTPRRWTNRARRLELAVCQGASLVSVTSDSFAELLAVRHGLDLSRCLVLPQGFDADFNEDSTFPDLFDGTTLELLYSGRFYAFRRADALVDAVTGMDGVRLNIATPSAPAYVTEAAAEFPEKVRVLGFVTHRTVLQLQRRCDILINLANDDPVQIPGKVNEYLGAGRPILHIGEMDGDATGRLIESLHAGWRVGRQRENIQALLRRICDDLPPSVDKARNLQAIEALSWRSLAAKWASRVQGLE